MKRWLLLTLVLAVGLGYARPAHAEASLDVSPQKYEDTLGTAAKSGSIDVSNPSDTTVSVVSEVAGFRQADLDGNLAFFHDDELSAGIKVGLTSFDLGPREAVRVSFVVDPTKLPKGGVYAVIFFRTIPPAVTSNTSYIAESANVGTLLMLQNGPGNAVGQVTQLTLPFWQFGSGLSGVAHYTNTNRNTSATAFSPALDLRVLPWGRLTKLSGPYVLPGSTRKFDLDRRGSYLGLVPVTLIDSASGHTKTRWVFAVTGWYQWLLGLGLIAGLGYLGWRLRGRLVARRGVSSTKPSIDGVSRRS